MPYHGLSWGFAEVFYLSLEEIHKQGLTDLDMEDLEPGWYWAAGRPGCLWDGEPMGPFDTEAEALVDAEGDFDGT